jgi:FlaA1/EpsC-like NDP-sugar epimerase
VPPLNELLRGKAQIGQLQQVRPEDLLGRQEIHLDFDQIRQQINGRRILVTGAAGSIGFQLSRQLATFEPDTLVLFDRAESGLYFAELELRRRHKHLRVVPVVGDILDRRKVEEVLDAYPPEVVYHTAAYKHVPLMEEHPLEAIENNVFGTEIMARASQERKVKKFVLISTDKAVNPVAIMGMTKRLAECLLFSLNGGSTAFVAVRFGNVLGTDGSVLPVFHWQISRGGPVTITDPDASRYFMLPSEAAQLVLQAGVMGNGGEVFFLDMGERIRIADLADNLIRLSGMEPGRDMPVEVMGLRPGERLREELVLASEEFIPTAHEKVFVVRNHNFEPADFSRNFEVLRSCVQSRDRERAVMQLREMALRYS